MIPSENEVGHPITNMLMGQANAVDMATADHADGAGLELASEAVGKLAGDAVVELSNEEKEAFTEFEHMIEGAREAITQRMDQFDHVEKNVVVIAADLVRVEGKLDQLLAHFGLLNTGS